jgi:hypothetical protein
VFQNQHEIVEFIPLDPDVPEEPLVPLVPLDPDVPLVPLDPIVPGIDTFPMQTVVPIVGVMVLLGCVDDTKLTPIW